MDSQKINTEQLISKAKLQRNIVFLIGIIVLISIMVHETSVTDQLKKTNQIWQDNTIYTTRVSEQLSLLEQAIGQGGVIEHYKNWVIYRDEKYVLKLEEGMDKLLRIISSYNVIPGLSKLEHDALKQIHASFTLLFKNYYSVIQKNIQYVSAQQLDQQISIDFSPVDEAIQILREQSKSHSQNAQNSASSEFKAVLGSFDYRYILLLIMSAVLLLFYWINKKLIQLNRSLNDSEEMVRAIVNSINVAIIIVDELGYIQHYNLHAIELTGYNEDELYNMSVEKLVPIEHREGHEKHRHHYMVDAATQHQTQFKRKMVVLNKSGKKIPVDISLSHVPTENGMIVIASIID